MSTMGGFPRAVHELEERFGRLEGRIPEGPEKEAISVLHGIVMEVWRSLERDRMPADGVSIADVADLWKGTPPMEGEALNQPLPVGAEAPDFALPDASGELVRLADFRGRTVVLVFYPLDWSPGCSQQLDPYEQELEEFRRRGAQLLGISVDSIYSHGAWAAVRGISFPLLADFAPKGRSPAATACGASRTGSASGRSTSWIPADGSPTRASRPGCTATPTSTSCSTRSRSPGGARR